MLLFGEAQKESFCQSAQSGFEMPFFSWFPSKNVENDSVLSHCFQANSHPARLYDG